MSEVKKSVIWAPEAQAQLRAIDRATALDILHAVDDYLTLGKGDAKKLRPPRGELRLRVGDYRVFLYQLAPLSIRITGVKHRSQAYR
ncbi:MAG: type II toxin-antitoxin system RelE/ParE family toxin [Terriglobia bacterium]|jgi:mRNA-degrading endonuclease RelE of RelBE toxin-antitoxin system